MIPVYGAIHLVAVMSRDEALDTMNVFASRSGTSHNQACVGSHTDVVTVSWGRIHVLGFLGPDLGCCGSS
jgi:hypothetical protein